MSRAHMEVPAPEYCVPPAAQWWRLPLYYSRLLPDGNLYTIQVDNADNPTAATWTFNDGEDEDIAPLTIRETVETDNCSYTRLVTDVRRHLDILAVGRPTASSWWLELTQPGRHWHPDYGKIPHHEWAAELIRQSDLFREGIL